MWYNPLVCSPERRLCFESTSGLNPHWSQTLGPKDTWVEATICPKGNVLKFAQIKGVFPHKRLSPNNQNCKSVEVSPELYKFGGLHFRPIGKPLGKKGKP